MVLHASADIHNVNNTKNAFLSILACANSDNEHCTPLSCYLEADPHTLAVSGIPDADCAGGKSGVTDVLCVQGELQVKVQVLTDEQ